jgi:DNA transposition AAA+ family ATPase
VSDSGTVEQLIERFIATMKSMNKALVIIDQVDKLKDSQLDLFMDFYNELDGHCGFVLSGVPALKRRIERGCQLDKIGYKELRSRIGRKYIQLANVSENDVTAVCKANGVNDEQVINEIYNTCEGDLRRVRRSIDQYFLMKEIA